jgi:kexin
MARHATYVCSDSHTRCEKAMHFEFSIELTRLVIVNTKDPDWQITHAGRPFNHKYGYGKLDAYRLVELAKTFEPVKPQAWLQIAKQAINKPMTKEGVGSSISITQDDLDVANLETLEHITVTVRAEHQRRGNMEVFLDSPHGIRSILARPRRFDDDKTGLPDWTFMSVKHWDEDPIGNWTLSMRDKQDNGKNGTFISWSMMLWGQAKNPDIATPYKMRNDDQILLPAPPHHKPTSNVTVTTVTHTSGTSTWTETTTLGVRPEHATTKSFLKPTAHLPDDHGQATGESDLPFVDDEIAQQTSTSTSSASDADSTKPASQGGDDDAEQEEEKVNYEDETYLGPWRSLVGDSTWFYIALGSVIIFLGGACAYFLHRRRVARGTGGGRGRGPFGGLFGGYGLLSGNDDDTLPMSALERGRGGTTRTRALYDAFALDDSSEDGSDAGDAPDTANERRSMTQERYDDSYMDSFLEDEHGAVEQEQEENGTRRPHRAEETADHEIAPRQSTPPLFGSDDESRPFRDDSP